MIATGCGDKNIRIYYLATSSENPLKVYTGENFIIIIMLVCWKTDKIYRNNLILFLFLIASRAYSKGIPG